MLEISIFLKKTFSTLRIDLNHKNCIVTKEDKKAPALVTPANTFLYKTYKEEIFHVAKQCRELDTNYKIDNVNFGSISKEQIHWICQYLNFEITDENALTVAKILNENGNPYN